MHCTDLTELSADPRTGAVAVQHVLDALRPSSLLVSIMLAQNETGQALILYDTVACCTGSDFFLPLCVYMYLKGCYSQ